MKQYLFIAEKSSLMKDVKKSYIKHKVDIEKEVGAIDFIALSGHACRFIEPKEYPEWNCKWKDIELPMIPKKFKIDKIPRMDGTLKEIKKKMDSGKYDGIIVGTDNDVEGNGIYYLLSNYLGITKIPTLRYFADDQTDKSIYKAFMSLTDFYCYPRNVHMTESFLIRSEMDWLIGMNFTTGTTVKCGFISKVGRVKTPTLKLVFDNCKAIDEFVPHTDFAVNANYKDGFNGSLVEQEIEESNGGAKYSYQSIRFETEEKAEEFIKELPDKGTVISLEFKKKTTGAPMLYSLSALQAEADAKYHYNPTDVLAIVQSLYETHKIVSYPRTSGRHISEAKAADFPEFIKACSFVPGLDAFTSKISKSDMDRAKKNKNMVNDTEVAKASHDALMPTGEIPNISKLSREELNVCTMIYKQFLAHFLPALVEEKTSLLVDVDGNLFKSNGKKVVESGWTDIFDKKLEEIIIPAYKKGAEIDIVSFETMAKTTQPPKRFTQGSLLTAMVNAAKYVDDKQLKETLKEAEGLGQESSRSAIIESLIKDGYMEEKKVKSGGLYMTELGNHYINNLKGYSITSPALSSIWEYKMKQIRQGLLPYEDAKAEMLEYVKKTVKEIETSDIKKDSLVGSKSSSSTKSGSSAHTCPVCKKNPLLKSKYGWYCGGKLDKSCMFSISQEIAHKKISEANMKQLVERGITNEIKGFKSKAGTGFSAKLRINGDKIEFEFEKERKK